MSRGEMEATAVADLLTRLSFYNENKEYEERMAWERVRLQTLRIVSVFVKKRITAETFWPMPWDKEQEEEPIQLTDEKKKQSLERLLEIDQRIWQQKQD